MTEKPKPSPVKLTPEYKKKIAPLKKRLEKEGQKGDRSITIVSGRAVDELRYHLNMYGRSSSPEDCPFYRASEIASGYLDRFSQDEETTGTRSMPCQVKSWLEGRFPSRNYGNYRDIHDAATVGLFLVLDVFKIELGEKFIDNLEKISAQEVMATFDSPAMQVGSGASLIERSESKLKIPKYQVFLREFVGDFVNFHSSYLGPQVELGANLGYSVIEKLWPKLKPGTNTNTARD